jgi:hypothetical protein
MLNMDLERRRTWIHTESTERNFLLQNRGIKVEGIEEPVMCITAAQRQSLYYSVDELAQIIGDV